MVTLLLTVKVPDVSVVRASPFRGERYVGATEQTIGTRSLDASAPVKELMNKFGFAPDQVVAAAGQQLPRARRE